MNDRAARQPAVDIAKLIAAVLVITIHTDPLLDLSGSANFVLVHIIARTAVPFFIVCTGFFLGKRFEYSHGRISNIPAARRATMKSAWKIGKLYLLCSVIYLLISIPQWISTGCFSAHAFLDWGVGVFLTGSYYHLWYLIEVFYALLVLALILPLFRKPFAWALITFLWIIEVLDYAYAMLLPSGIQTAFAWLDKLQMPFESVVRVLPLLLLGMVIARQKPWKWWVNLLGLVLSLVCLVLEVYGVRALGGERFSYVFSTFPVAGFLFSAIHSLDPVLPWKNTRCLANISTFVYLAHPAYKALLEMIVIPSHFVEFLIVTVLSLVTGYLYYILSESRKRRRQRTL